MRCLVLGHLDPCTLVSSLPNLWNSTGAPSLCGAPVGILMMVVESAVLQNLIKIFRSGLRSGECESCSIKELLCPRDVGVGHCGKDHSHHPRIKEITQNNFVMICTDSFLLLTVFPIICHLSGYITVIVKANEIIVV